MDYYYISIAEALADAQEGATLTLIADNEVSEPIIIQAGSKIKLDLQGHSISGNITAASKKLIQNYGELEFVGNSGGCIYNTNTQAQGHAACQTLTGGTTTVNSPIHFGDSDTDMTNANSINRGCGIQNNGGTLIINDGYYTACDNFTNGGWAYAILNCSGTTVINNATTYGLNNGSIGCESGSVTVNDGTFTLEGDKSYYNLYACETGVIDVNGGTFVKNGNYAAMCVDTDGFTTAAINVKGGLFTLSKGDNVLPIKATSATDSALVIAGGTFKKSADTVYEVPVKYIAENYEQNLETGKVVKTVAENGTNISIADTINENFYIDEDYYETNYGNDVYVNINYNHNSNESEETNFQTETVKLSSLPSFDDATSAYNGARMLSVLQAPAQSTEDITITVYTNQADAEEDAENEEKDDAVDEITYSVYKYCKAILADTTADEKLVELAEATLDYAAAAQTYFDYNTGNMANDGAYHNDVDAVDFADAGSFSDPNGIIKALNCNVLSDLQINLYSTYQISATSASIAATSGKDRFAVSTTDNNGYTQISITGIEPVNMNKVITVNTTLGTVKFTANSVMKMMAESGDANAETLAKAMYLYGAAANAYFA
jgi:hypothetical protein